MNDIVQFLARHETVAADWRGVSVASVFANTREFGSYRGRRAGPFWKLEPAPWKRGERNHGGGYLSGPSKAVVLRNAIHYAKISLGAADDQFTCFFGNGNRIKTHLRQ